MTNFLNNINIQAMVVPSTENQLLTWVEFRADLLDRKDRFDFPTVGEAYKAYKDIYDEICDDLAEQGLLLNSSSSPLLYEICLKNGAKIFLGKFWPEDVIDNNVYVRMWAEETWRYSEDIVGILKKAAAFNKVL